MSLVGYEATPSRIALSLIAGAFVGASLIALWWIFGTAQSHGIQYLLHYGALPAVTVFFVALVVWAVGLVLFGVPLWWVMHVLGLRHWVVATLVGATLTFLVNLGIGTQLFGLIPQAAYSASDSGGPTVVANQLTPHGWNMALIGALQLSTAGALVALVIWRVAYRSANLICGDPAI